MKNRFGRFPIKYHHIRRFFHWHPSVILPLLWTTGPTMWALGAGLPYPNLWFVLAYVVFAVAFIWSIACWLTSDFLDNQNPLRGNRAARRRAEKAETAAINSKIFRAWQLGVSGLICAFFLVSIYVTSQISLNVELAQSFGRLYPGTDVLPNACKGSIDDGALALFLGKYVSITHSFPHTVLEVKGEKTLVLDKVSDGSLAVSFVVRSHDHRIIAKFDGGEFIINQNNILKQSRRDRHSLELIDQFGEKVLSMRYFNPRAMWIDVTLPAITFRGSETGSGANCLVDNGVSIGIE